MTLTGPFTVACMVPLFATVEAIFKEGFSVVRPCFALSLFPLEQVPEALMALLAERQAALVAASLLVLATACAFGGVALLRSALAAIDATGGTIAPDDPPPTLLTRGPYGHVRNPMALATLMLLIAEAILLGLEKLVWLAGIYTAFLAAYTPCSEEATLRARFGVGWVHYKVNVPAWLPRCSPWDAAREQV